MILRHCEVYIKESLADSSFIQSVIDKYATIKEYAYVLHDKDIDDKGKLIDAHWHIYLRFGVPVDMENIAKWFNTTTNFIERIKGGRKSAVRYLVHDNAKDKYQYSIDSVKSNFDVKAIIDSASMFDRFTDFDNYSYAQHIQFIKEHIEPKSRVIAHKILKENWLLHTEYIAIQGNRNMKVIFICGGAGVGKSTMAKLMAEKVGDYSVSSSSNDSLQDYKGQKVLILDDFRDDVFSFSDLLKLLDNHTNSSVKARYYNKVFNGELIIITTTKPLELWFPDIKEDKTQLYRRINEYILMTFDTVKITTSINFSSGVPSWSGSVEYPNMTKAIYSKNPKEIIAISAKFFESMAKDENLLNALDKIIEENNKLPF